MECPCCGYHDEEERDTRPLYGPRTQIMDAMHEANMAQFRHTLRLASQLFDFHGPKIGDTIHIRKPEPFRAKMA